MDNPVIQTKKMSKASQKKRNFIVCELMTLPSEVEARTNILFSILSSGIYSKRKKCSGSMWWKLSMWWAQKTALLITKKKKEKKK